jgi:hypothetical protein
MKSIFTFLLLGILAVGVSAQYALPADFETLEEDTVWTQFANVDDLPENMALVANPATDGINTSANCLWFNVLAGADPWAGASAIAYGPHTFSAENYMMEMMVHKTVASRCGIKLEDGDTDNVEALVANTKVGEWELITFDMTAAIGHTFNKLVFFPDFPDSRTAGSVCHVDNIGFVGGGTSVNPDVATALTLYPNPVVDRVTVQHPGMSSVVITNILGQRVKALQFQQSDREIIDLNELTPGFYFLNLETANGLVTSKFIKE